MPTIKKTLPIISKKSCSNCFKSNHIVFNFAYVVYDKDFNDSDKIELVNRMREVSEITYIELMNLPKYKAFEEDKVKIKKDIPLGFETDIQKFDGKYSIMRLYKNNIPNPGRIIGKLVNKVFYIFYLDSKGKLYSH